MDIGEPGWGDDLQAVALFEGWKNCGAVLFENSVVDASEFENPTHMIDKVASWAENEARDEDSQIWLSYSLWTRDKGDTGLPTTGVAVAVRMSRERTDAIQFRIKHDRRDNPSIGRAMKAEPGNLIVESPWCNFLYDGEGDIL